MASAILKNKDYDLISVIYHASQGCETARQYAADAEKEKDKEAAGFFNKALELNGQLVQTGKEFSSSVCEMQLHPRALPTRLLERLRDH